MALPEELPCPLCRRGMPVKWTFKEKPYCICNGCGIQLFIRGSEGIERLEKILERQRHQRATA